MVRYMVASAGSGAKCGDLGCHGGTVTRPCQDGVPMADKRAFGMAVACGAVRNATVVAALNTAQAQAQAEAARARAAGAAGVGGLGKGALPGPYNITAVGVYDRARSCYLNMQGNQQAGAPPPSPSSPTGVESAVTATVLANNTECVAGQMGSAKKVVMFFGWVFNLISSGGQAPHVPRAHMHMGVHHTCGGGQTKSS